MEVIIAEDRDAVAQLVADAVCSLVDRRPAAVLGLATGSTPRPTYAELADRARLGLVSFERTRVFTLDEYLGLAPDDEHLYLNEIRARFTDPAGIPVERVHAPDSRPDDPDAECRAYEQQIRDAGGIDLQLLGIGRNGHVAYNEPTSSLASRTRVTTLTESSRRDIAGHFTPTPDHDSPVEPDANVPRDVITQGLGTILEARHVILMATGPHKADAVAAMVEGPVSAMIPASVLQFHPQTTVVVDEAAGAALQLADHYRYVQQHDVEQPDPFT